MVLSYVNVGDLSPDTKPVVQPLTFASVYHPVHAGQVLSRDQYLTREQQLLAAQQQLQEYQALTGFVKQPKTVNTYLVGAGSGFTAGSGGSPAVHSLKITPDASYVTQTAYGGVVHYPAGYSLPNPLSQQSNASTGAAWAVFGGDASASAALLAAPATPAVQWGGLVVPKVSPYVTANRGLETLASSVDVEALDASEAVALPFQPAAKSLDLSALALKNPALAFNARPDIDLSVQQRLSSWTPGWKVEMGLDSQEQAQLKAALGSNSGGVLESLVRKLWSVGNSVCNQTDRFYSHLQRAYAHEIPALQQEKAELTARTKAAEAFSQQSQSQVVEQQAKELVVLRKEREKRVDVCKQLKDAIRCPICTEVAVLPKVLGTCGHIACQNCLKQLDDVAFATLSASGAGASARQHLLARRCPLCRAEIIGAAFPVHPQKEVASILIAAGYIDVADQISMQRHIEFKAISFEKETPEQKHIAALQIGCYAQSQLAQHSVAEVITKINTEQWRNGVYIMFESAVSRVFFETFATTLHGKAGGVNVLVNAAQRMLAVKLVDRKKDQADTKASNVPHLLVKVATDGRFTITTATAANAVASAATGDAQKAAAETAGGSAGLPAASNTAAAATPSSSVVALAAATSNSGSDSSLMTDAGSTVLFTGPVRTPNRP